MYEIEANSNQQIGATYTYRRSNPFYLLAPSYYMPFYTQFLRPLLMRYDGYVPEWHNFKRGIYPEKLAQTVNSGLWGLIFAHGIDFTGKGTLDTDFARKWATEVDLFKTLLTSCEQSGAGGTSLLAINRNGRKLSIATYRIDQYYADFNASGEVTRARIFFDLCTDTVRNEKHHYGICEERYFNSDGVPCVKSAVYIAGGNDQTAVASRPRSADEGIPWENLPYKVKKFINTNYKGLRIGLEHYLPFADSLGLFPLKYTANLPSIPGSPFGRPITDIIGTECFEWDQIKGFGKNETEVAKEKVLMPEEMINKDDPDNPSQFYDSSLFQKVDSNSIDDNKPTVLSFPFRTSEIKVREEEILRSVAFKLNVSASTIASFLSEGAHETTAAAILSEKTKTDAWISTQIGLIAPVINRLLNKVMRYYDHNPVSIVFKSQAQSPTLETAKIYMDMYSQGGLSPRLFIKKVFPELSEEEQATEIARLEEIQQAKLGILKNEVPPQK